MSSPAITTGGCEEQPEADPDRRLSDFLWRRQRRSKPLVTCSRRSARCCASSASRPTRCSGAWPSGVRRGLAPDRETASPRRGVRLHRRRRRGRAHAGRQPEAFARTSFRPRVLRGVEEVDSSRAVLGRPLAYPLVLAPTGFTRIADPHGELAVARAADRAGLPYTLSTLSTRSIEEVRAVSDGRQWFQVYAWRDRGAGQGDGRSGRRRGYEALVLTVDTAVLGRRERDVRRGFSLPPSIGPARSSTGSCIRVDLGLRPQRADPFRQRGRPGCRRRRVARCDCRTTSTLSSTRAFVGRRRMVALGVGRPVILKGMQTVADAVLAAEPGSTRWRCRTTVAANSTVRRPLRAGGPGRRRGRRPSRGHLRRRRAARQRHRQGARRRGQRAWPGAPTSTASVRPGNAAWTGSSAGFGPTWCAR